MARVALFDPCYMSTLRPQDIGFARHVLEALGDSVTLIDGRCCGQPAFNSGFRAEAKTVGRQLLKAAQPHQVVVTPSGSCTSMVRHYLPTLFEGSRAAGATSIASRFADFASYVGTHPRIDKVLFKLEGTVTYHDSCHARRELHAGGAAMGLLQRVQGLEVRPLAYPEECCGFGGTFSAKQPEISVAMMTSRLDDVSLTGARVLVSSDYSCLAHLESGARGIGMQVQGWSLAELLSRALS
ncbi:MAG: (Fe-S)-binding protein [Dehalococcoidia bacterium]